MRIIEHCLPKPTKITKGRARVAAEVFRQVGQRFDPEDFIRLQERLLSGPLGDHMAKARAYWEEDVAIRTDPPSPLRVPGGKGPGRKYILPVIPDHWGEILSPFFGGGNLEIDLALNRGVRIFGYDLYAPLVDFWQIQLSQREALADRIADLFLMKALLYHTDKTFFKRCQEALHLFERRLDTAACFFWLNRGSFSGSTCSGGKPREHHARFTLSSIEKVRRFECPLVSVNKSDFRDSLSRHPTLPAYLDPPYLVDSKLYGKNGDLHVAFPHNELATILGNRSQWVLSYNDCQRIRDLYAGYRILQPEWTYCMPKHKKSSELLILSHDIKMI